MATSSDPIPSELDETYEDSGSSLLQQIQEELGRKNEELGRKNEQLNAARANEALLLNMLHEQRRQQPTIGADLPRRSYEDLQQEVEGLRETVMSLQSLVTSLYVDFHAAKKRTDDRQERLESAVIASSDAHDSLVQGVIDLDRRVDRLDGSRDLERPRDGYSYTAPPTRDEEGSMYGRPYYEHQGRELATMPPSGNHRPENRPGTASETETYTQTTTTEYRVQVSQRHTTTFGHDMNRDTGFGGSASETLPRTTTTCTAIQEHQQPVNVVRAPRDDRKEKDVESHSKGNESSGVPVQPSPIPEPPEQLPQFSNRRGMPSHANSLPTQLPRAANGFASPPLASGQVLYASYQEGLDHVDYQP